MSKFLSEDVLNDYISPSQVCIKPTEIVESKNKNKSVTQKEGEDNDDDNNGVEEFEVGKESEDLDPSLNKVSITLDDCLACSGCVTSSEEIILDQQSYQVFLKDYKETIDKTSSSENSSNNSIEMLVSISPQCRVSLSEYFQIHDVKTFDITFINLLEDVFKGHCNYIVSTQVGREIVIKENNLKISSRNNTTTEKNLPLLTSVCPGVVMYIEKTHPKIVDYFIDVKSPVSITGNLIKTILKNNTSGSTTSKNKNGKLYHLSIMPCFDKKLEAVKTKDDIQCVITPKEFVNMLIDMKVDFKNYIPKDKSELKAQREENYDELINKFNPFFKNGLNIQGKEMWSINSGSSSGGFAYQYILDQYEKKIVEREYQDKKLSIDVINGKNSDIREYRLSYSCETALENNKKTMICSASEVYGFRNIQNIIRKYDEVLNNVKTKKRGLITKRSTLLTSRRQQRAKQEETSVVVGGEPVKQEVVVVVDEWKCDPLKSDVIEIMACPGGCINGGGLVLPSSFNSQNNNSRKKTQYINLLNEIYHTQMESFPISNTNSRNTELNSVLSQFQEYTDFKYTFNKLDQSESSTTNTTSSVSSNSTSDTNASLFSSW